MAMNVVVTQTGKLTLTGQMPVVPGGVPGGGGVPGEPVPVPTAPEPPREPNIQIVYDATIELITDPSPARLQSFVNRLSSVDSQHLWMQTFRRYPQRT